MSDWLPLPGPPFFVGSSEPHLLGTASADDFLGHVAANGAHSVVVDLTDVASTADVIAAFGARLELPDWCGSGWDSVEHAFEELCAAGAFPLAVLVQGAGRVAADRPQLALETVVRLAALVHAFSVTGDQLIVVYDWKLVDLPFFASFRLSLQRALWATIPPSLRAIAVGSSGGVGHARFLFDGVPGEVEDELVWEVESEVVSDFPATARFDFRAVKDEGRLCFESGETWWAYVRREPDGPGVHVVSGDGLHP